MGLRVFPHGLYAEVGVPSRWFRPLLERPRHYPGLFAKSGVLTPGTSGRGGSDSPQYPVCPPRGPLPLPPHYLDGRITPTVGVDL